MIVKPRYKRQLKCIVLLSIILMSLLNTLIFSTYKSNDSAEMNESEEDINAIDDIPKQIEDPKTSLLGNDTWWNRFYKFRRIISVTNTHSVNFTDFGVQVTFNYANFGSDIQSDLDDIRIIENGIERRHYVKKDYPSASYATVWFDTNITAGETETDVYMYYGNSSVGNNIADDPDESFGWVKNGDFELDTSTATKYIPFGWNFTDDPVNYVTDDHISLDAGSECSWYEPHNYTNPSYPGDWSYENFVFQTISSSEAANQEDVGSGNYAYKYGSPANSVLGGDAQTAEYVGTFYSYPFKVPIIDDGNGEIKLKLWRNIRTHVFEDLTGGGGRTIEQDGYWMRICNYTPALYNDVDAHENGDDVAYTNYIEKFGGEAHLSGQNYIDVNKLEEHFRTSNYVDTGLVADLTGNITFDISKYMGKVIFLEMGTWGEEDWKPRPGYPRSGFFQLDSVQFNYTLTASMEEKQKQKSNIDIIAKDVDGRLVPNVEIFIVNESARGEPDFIVKSGTTTDGSKLFTNVLRGRYNITVNYTLGSKTEEVFNSTESGEGPYYINGIDYTIELALDIWTIDFEIVDNDGIYVPYGYINIRTSEIGESLINLSLNEDPSNPGKVTFRWRNTTRYYFEVYYNDEDYKNFIPKLLNKSYIYRSDYQNNDKEFEHILNVNETNKKSPNLKSFLVEEYIYTNGSRTEFSNKKIISVDIKLENMVDSVENISIYYIDENNSPGSGNNNLLYFNDYDPPPFVENDLISIDIMTEDNTKLASENYFAYGLYIVVNGINVSQCNGKITINTVETCNVYNRTKLAKLNIRVIQISDTAPQGAPLSASILIKENSTQSSLVTLKAYSSRNGYAYSQTNDVEFWYVIGTVLNISLKVANLTETEFNVTKIVNNPLNQWYPKENSPGVLWYNYTHATYDNITFNVIYSEYINMTYYATAFNITYGETDTLWGGNLTFWAIFVSTEDNWKTPPPYDFVNDPPGTCTLKIKLATTGTLLVSEKMHFVEDGNYSITFNTSVLSAGYNKELYSFEIHGFHPVYENPNYEPFLVTIRALSTGISAHDYYDNYDVVSDKMFEVVYEKYINISVRYYLSSNNDLLESANLTYTWEGVGPYVINLDPANPDYFTFLLYSGDALGLDVRTLTITAKLENYKMLVFDIFIDISPKPSLINGENNPLSKDWKVYVKDAKNYLISYSEAETGDLLSDAYKYYYNWYEGDSYVDDYYLIKNHDGTYTLDCDTETRAVGQYRMKIFLEQENYKQQSLEIGLEIMLRTFDADVDANNYKDDQVTVVHGEEIELEITLLDESRGIPLVGATVKLDIGGKDYDFDDDGNGVYTLTYETEDLEAFFTSKTMTGEITIEKEDFVSEEIEITFVITMEEIYPGMPTFYFIMIVSSISAVAGALIGYRVIQQARIPKFVKKVRAVKKAIKSNSAIPSISITSKNKMFLKELGKEWSDLGISLRSILGVEAKKSPIRKAKELIKQKGDDK